MTQLGRKDTKVWTESVEGKTEKKPGSKSYDI